MATRLYLSNNTGVPTITPTPSGDWEDTSDYSYLLMPAVLPGVAFLDFDFTDADSSNKDVLICQFMSYPLTAGQTITGSGAYKAQIAGHLLGGGAPGANMALALGLRVIGGDGTTVRKTIFGVTRDDNIYTLSQANRRFTVTGAAGDYTTVDGDCLVLESGGGGTPGMLSSHSMSLRLGSNHASDLPEDDTDTADKNPWLELPDSLTFVTPAPVARPLFLYQALNRASFY